MGLPDHHPSEDLETGLPTLLRPNEVARRLAVSRAWIYEAARTGRIPSVRLGGDDGPLRFIAVDVERWLAESRANWGPGRSWRPGDPQGEEDRSVVPIRGQQSLL